MRGQARALQGRADDFHQVAALELHRRKIDRHADSRRPLRGLHEGFVEHPFADRIDQAGIFGQPDEDIGCDQAAHRMAPAQQRLEADHLALPEAEADDRLVVQFEFVLLDRASKVDLQAASALRLLVHLRAKEGEGAAPGRLRGIQRHVGLLHQIVGVGAVVRRQHQADARADHDLVAVDLERHRQHTHQPLRQAARGAGLRTAALDDGELVAAQARDQIVVAQALAHALRYQTQQGIAHRVAERVVDGLEAVQVDAQHGQRRGRAAGREARVQALAEENPVRQPGQLVVVRHAFDLRHGAFALGDVFVGRDPAAVRHGLVVDREGAAVLQREEGVRRFPRYRDPGPPAEVFGRRHVRPRADLEALVDDLAEQRSRQQMLRLEPVHLGIAAVAEDQALLAVEEAQAVRDIVDRRQEAALLGPVVVEQPVEQARGTLVGGSRDDGGEQHAAADQQRGRDALRRELECSERDARRDRQPCQHAAEADHAS